MLLRHAFPGAGPHHWWLLSVSRILPGARNPAWVGAGRRVRASVPLRCCLQQPSASVIPSKPAEGGEIGLAGGEQGHRRDDEQAAGGSVGGELAADGGAEFLQARGAGERCGDYDGGDPLSPLGIW